MSKEIGTLKELKVKPGDVVECIHGAGGVMEGSYYKITGDYKINGHPIREVNCSEFQVVSRASEAPADYPKLWKDMTPEEKGALLLADYEGKTIQYYDKLWHVAPVGVFRDKFAYRVKPEPYHKQVALYFGELRVGALVSRVRTDTHRITFDLIDGKPDCNSIKMEEI